MDRVVPRLRPPRDDADADASTRVVIDIDVVIVVVVVVVLASDADGRRGVTRRMDVAGQVREISRKRYREESGAREESRRMRARDGNETRDGVEDGMDGSSGRAVGRSGSRSVVAASASILRRDVSVNKRTKSYAFG